MIKRDASASWVLLHGTPLDPKVWDGVVPYLINSHPVVCPSAAPQLQDANPQVDIARRLLTHLPEGGLNIVGHSFGGQIALELALAAPERLRSLTILCSRDTPYPPFAAVAAALHSGAPTDVNATIGRWFTPKEIAFDSPAVQYVKTRMPFADRDVWGKALDAIATYDRSTSVGQINVPTTLIAAADDPVSNPDVMRDFANRLPKAKFNVRDGMHMSIFTDPAMLAGLLQTAAYG